MMEHRPIMLQEVIEALQIKGNGIYVDGTFGRGGHSSEILKSLNDGKLIVFDQDEEAIKAAQRLKEVYPTKLVICRENFRNLDMTLDKHGIDHVDGILLDLGVSSPQFDDPERGFSYRYDARLDMRMDQSQALDAYHVVNHYPFEKLTYIFSHYGEEKFAKQIARRIEQERAIKPIETSLALVDVIKSALPMKVLSQKGHPAKQVFQAIRIEVNQELKALEEVLDQAAKRLNSNGRLVIITFHSLEDRMVKKFMQKLSTVDIPSKLPIQGVPEAAYEHLTHKVIIPSASECESNPRAHSAKLRVLRKR
jgi:16S rRNA (cytosine1402-N4)-methyltransferase